MKATNLIALPMAVLVRIHNQLLNQGDKEATTKTFSQRSKAVEKIEKLAKERGIDASKRFDEEGNMREVTPPAPPAEKPADKAADKPKASKREKAEKKDKGPSIRSVAEELLLEVVGKDEDKRPVGHSYEAILDMIKAKFPGAKTTVACLRWYAVHMRERGVLPPSRPRAVATAPAQEKKAA